VTLIRGSFFADLRKKRAISLAKTWAARTYALNPNWEDSLYQIRAGDKHLSVSDILYEEITKKPAIPEKKQKKGWPLLSHPMKAAGLL
jgi:hypothetical protein